MNQQPKKPTDPQVIVVLRVIGGAYLLYLAWGLREAAFSGRGIVYPLAMVIFAVAGALLLFFSVRKLYRRDFLYPWQTPEDFEDEDDPALSDEDGQPLE